MGEPYKSGGEWFQNGNAMSQLDIDLMNMKKEPVGKTKGLGLNSETMKPKVNEKKKPIQKKPRPPAEMDKAVNSLLKSRKRFSNGIKDMLFKD